MEKIFVTRHASKYVKSAKKMEQIFKECAGLKFRSVNLNQTIDPKFVFNTINKCIFLSYINMSGGHRCKHG